MGMALAVAVSIFIGFAPSYYLRAIYTPPPLPPLVHFHWLLFTLWVALLAMQTVLVAVKRTDLHRKLGIAGMVLAAIMTVVGFATAVEAGRLHRMPLDFLVVPLAGVVVFPALVGAAFFWRRQPEVHKRLILIATAELLTAGVGRWPQVRDWGALGGYAVTDLFVVALLIYDVSTRRRPHPATVWGGLFFIGSQVLRTAVGKTQVWLAFAAWLAGTH
jgi:hypothetical protein